MRPLLSRRGSISATRQQLAYGDPVPWFRITCKPGHTEDGQAGRSSRFMVITSSNTPKLGYSSTGHNSEGRYFTVPETWYQVHTFRVQSGSMRPGRILDWHDHSWPGYQWGGVASPAVDLRMDQATSPDTGEQNEVVHQYLWDNGGSYTNLGPSPLSTGYHWQLGDTPQVIDYGRWYYYWTETKLCKEPPLNGYFKSWLTWAGGPTNVSPNCWISNARTINSRTDYYPGCNFIQGAYIDRNYNSGPDIVIDHMMGLAGQSWASAIRDIPRQARNVDTNEILVWGDTDYNTLVQMGTIDRSSLVIPDAIAAVL